MCTGACLLRGRIVGSRTGLNTAADGCGLGERWQTQTVTRDSNPQGSRPKAMGKDEARLQNRNYGLGDNKFGL
jgi:hypothetical protein